MNKDKRCETCINNGCYNGEFCRICVGGDMYKKRREVMTDYSRYSSSGCSYHPRSTLPITNVIFAPPATIVFWNDGTKTVVKCENEVFDPEKGLAMAIAKRALGNKGNYYETFKKWIPDDIKIPQPKKKEKPWKIWVQDLDKEGKVNGAMVLPNEYTRKGNAVRAAKKRFGDPEQYRFIVAQENPWVKE